MIDFTSPESKTKEGKKVQQIFRKCAGYQQVFEFGHSYVSLGFLDLWLLMDGTYLNLDQGVLKFYGFDSNMLAVARSLLVLEMLKAPFEEVCSKTILQVWFSSCWDAQTKSQFTSFVEKYLSSKERDQVLQMYAETWTQRMTDMAFNKDKKKNKFTMPPPDDSPFGPYFNFIPLLNLKREGDRVRYMR